MKKLNEPLLRGILLEPKTGIYLEDPIAVLDYASLYPTSIKEKNLSHDTYYGEYDEVKDKLNNLGWKDEEDYNCVKYHDYKYVSNIIRFVAQRTIKCSKKNSSRY